MDIPMASLISKPSTKSTGTRIIPPPIPKKPDIVPIKIPTSISSMTIYIAPKINLKL
jgi:hypothetical protein